MATSTAEWENLAAGGSPAPPWVGYESGEESEKVTKVQKCIGHEIDGCHDFEFHGCEKDGLKVHKGMHFAVRFEGGSIDNLSLDNCLFINVVFDGCFLHDTLLCNIFLMDVKVTGCIFNNYTWQNGKRQDLELEGLVFEGLEMGDEVPEEIANPKWALKTLAPQAKDGSKKADQKAEKKAEKATAGPSVPQKAPEKSVPSNATSMSSFSQANSSGSESSEAAASYGSKGKAKATAAVLGLYDIEGGALLGNRTSGENSCVGFFKAVKYQDCVIDNTRFENCTLIDVTFDNCVFKHALFANVYLRNVTFTGCDFVGTTWCEDEGECLVVKRDSFDEYFPRKCKRGAGVPMEVTNKEWLKRQHDLVAPPQTQQDADLAKALQVEEDEKPTWHNMAEAYSTKSIWASSETANPNDKGKGTTVAWQQMAKNAKSKTSSDSGSANTKKGKKPSLKPRGAEGTTCLTVFGSATATQDAKVETQEATSSPSTPNAPKVDKNGFVVVDHPFFSAATPEHVDPPKAALRSEHFELGIEKRRREAAAARHPTASRPLASRPQLTPSTTAATDS